MPDANAGEEILRWSAQRDSHLMRLPAELRNRVYEFALIEPDRVTIAHNNTAQPAFLATCHQIRKEAGPIYYHQNQFLFSCANYDSTAMRAWMQHGRHFVLKNGFAPPKNFSILIWPANLIMAQTLPSWQNLLGWARAVHAGSEVPAVPVNEGGLIHGRVAGRVLDIAAELMDLSWKRVEAVITHVKEMASDQQWAD